MNDLLIDTDLAPYSWRDLKPIIHKTIGLWEFNPSEVTFFLSEKQKSYSASQGFDLQKEIENEKVLNATVLDNLLKYPKFIPKEWRRAETGTILFTYFWGTIYADSKGNMYVRCLLSLGKDGWCCSLNLLSYGFAYNEPALILK